MWKLGKIILQASRLANYFVVVSYVSLTIVTVSTVVDICLRYVFGSPVLGVIELNECLMPLIVFTAVAVTQHEKGHIRVTLIVKHFPRKLAWYMELAAYTIGLIFIFTMAVLTWRDAMNSYHRSEAVMLGIQTFPIWWSKFFVPLGLWALSLQYLADILNQFFLFGSAASVPEVDVVQADVHV